MDWIYRYIAAIFIALTLPALAAAAGPAVGHDHHMPVPQPGDVTCINQCIAQSDTPGLVPAVSHVISIASAWLAYVAIVATLAFALIQHLAYSARPRPSPNFVKLYAHYLD